MSNHCVGKIETTVCQHMRQPVGTECFLKENFSKNAQLGCMHKDDIGLGIVKFENFKLVLV